ncbi:MAG: hypothetical protein CMH57_01410 [Myxococcales bacterium]|nr:hypothetical protein [Myxococcales bacterium]
MRHTNAHPRLGLLTAILLTATLLIACGDDFGTECTLPDTEVVQLACEETQDENTDDGQTARSSASCVIKNIIECDDRLCAKYRGSQPFCTRTCSADADCPGSAFCAEFVIGTGEKYCVKAELSGS